MKLISLPLAVAAATDEGRTLYGNALVWALGRPAAVSHASPDNPTEVASGR